MKVKDFLSVLNIQVKYKVTDRRTKEELKLNFISNYAIKIIKG